MIPRRLQIDRKQPINRILKRGETVCKTAPFRFSSPVFPTRPQEAQNARAKPPKRAKIFCKKG